MFSVLPVIVAQKHPHRNEQASLAHSYSDSSGKAEATAFHCPAVLSDSHVCLSQGLLVLCSFPGPVDTSTIHLSQTVSESGIHRKLCDSRAYWTTGIASGTRVGDKVVVKTRCSSGCSGTHSGVYASHLTSSPSWDLPTMLIIGLELTCPNIGLEKSQSLHESVVELQEPRSRLVAAV